MRIKIQLLLVALSLLPLTRPVQPEAPEVQANAGGSSLPELDWLAGHWRQGAPDSGAMVEELWMPPRGGLMLGLNRTTVAGGERATAWEYLRIEQRGKKVVYLASPGGRSPATPFTLTELGPSRAVFENPEHDYPRRIEYHLTDAGQLEVQLSGEEPGGESGPDWTFNAVGRVR